MQVKLTTRFHCLNKIPTKKKYQINNKINYFLPNYKKDKIDIRDNKDVVYQLNCSCGKHYIGETSQFLKNRIRGHVSSTNNFDLATALSYHIIKTNHYMDYNYPKILDIEKNMFKRRILENININFDKISINFKGKNEKLNKIYKSPINAIKDFTKKFL